MGKSLDFRICHPPPVVMCQMVIFILYFLKVNSVVFFFYNGENLFQIRELVAGLHVFEYGGTTFGTLGKTCFIC